MQTSQMTSTLLVIAHRGEAQEFLRRWNCVRLNHPGLPFDVFESEDKSHLVVISGEGLQNASECTTASLAIFFDRIAKVANLGIAGTLSSQLEVGQTVAVRTCYAQKNERVMEFKSFSSNDSQAAVDIVSARDRVLEGLVAQHLGCFAAIVDREAWAVASAAARFGRPFFCLKYISDRAKDAEICKIAKQMSLHFSQQLFHKYLEYVDQPSLPREEQTLPAELYFTKAQADRFHSLVRKLSQKWGENMQAVWPRLIEDKLLADLLVSEEPAKQRTQKVLQYMSRLQNPFHAELESKVRGAITPLTSKGIDVEFDEDMKEVKISSKAKTMQDYDKHLALLQAYNFQELQDILEGKI